MRGKTRQAKGEATMVATTTEITIQAWAVGTASNMMVAWAEATSTREMEVWEEETSTREMVAWEEVTLTIEMKAMEEVTSTREMEVWEEETVVSLTAATVEGLEVEMEASTIVGAKDKEETSMANQEDVEETATITKIPEETSRAGPSTTLATREPTLEEEGTRTLAVDDLHSPKDTTMRQFSVSTHKCLTRLTMAPCMTAHQFRAPISMEETSLQLWPQDTTWQTTMQSPMKPPAR